LLACIVPTPTPLAAFTAGDAQAGEGRLDRGKLEVGARHPPDRAGGHPLGEPRGHALSHEGGLSDGGVEAAQARRRTLELGAVAGLWFRVTIETIGVRAS
jgi:hypothetical protein